MVLARLAKSLRRHDWTTFAVEFILVIAGVLIALEVDNWNQQRVSEREFRRELALLQAELRENRVRLTSSIQRMEHNLSVLTAFQRAFHDENLASHDEQREAFVPALAVTGDYARLIRSTGVERLLGSDGIVEERFESLRHGLERWNLYVSGYRQVANDRLRYGHEVVLPLFTETHSLVASAERWLRDTPYRLDPSGRHDELQDVLADPRVENAIVISVIIENEVLDHARRLDQVSEEAIAEIDRLLAASPR